jgi:hypothetical protein
VFLGGMLSVLIVLIRYFAANIQNTIVEKQPLN